MLHPRVSVAELRLLLERVSSVSECHEREKNLAFLFDLLLLFKGARATELRVPRSRLEQLSGAHRNTYVRRLAFAARRGIIDLDPDFEFNRRRFGVMRTVRLAIPLCLAGEFENLQEGLRQLGTTHDVEPLVGPSPKKPDPKRSRKLATAISLPGDLQGPSPIQNPRRRR